MYPVHPDVESAYLSGRLHQFDYDVIVNLPTESQVGLMEKWTDGVKFYSVNDVVERHAKPDRPVSRRYGKSE